MTLKSMIYLASMASAVAIAVSATPALAQEAVSQPTGREAEEGGFASIVVTARRREESAQDVPVAVSVMDSAVLERRGSLDPVDLGKIATGLFANSYNGDRSNIIYTIRGQAFTTGTLFPAVMPYFAEVPLNKLFVGTFFDLENVQVLRGPQGTLFGRVTDGGNILISPAMPKDRLEGEIQAKVGNYDLRSVNAMLNVPVVPGKLLVRAAGEINRRDGFTTNVLNGKKLDGVHYESARVSVLATPVDGLENYTTFNYTHADEPGGSSQLYYVNRPALVQVLTSVAGAVGANSVADRVEAALARQQAAGPRKSFNNVDLFDKRRQIILVNRTSLELTDNITAKAILGYINTKQRTSTDYDGNEAIIQETRSSSIPSLHQKHISGEFQLQGKSFNNSLDWTLGAYFDKQSPAGEFESLSAAVLILYRATVQRAVTKSRAAYGQVTYAPQGLLDGLRITGGLRYTKDTVVANSAVWSALIATTPDPIPHGQCLTARPAGVLGSSIPCATTRAGFSKTTWNVGLDYRVNNDVLLYGKISRGYRPGGFNSTAVASSYGPETVTSHELGIKSDWRVFGRPLRFNLAAFYDDFNDIQRLVIVNDATGSTSANVNTKSAVVKGIELEAQFRPIDGLELGVRYTYLKAHYNVGEYDPAYVAAACPANPRITAPDPSKFCPLSPFARTPKNTLGLNARYTTNIGETELSFGGDWYFTDSQYAVTSGYVTPEVRMPAYNVLNLDVTANNIGGLPIDVTVFGTNVTNKTYISTFSSASQMGSLGITQYSYGAPRMYGVSLRYRFGK